MDAGISKLQGFGTYYRLAGWQTRVLIFRILLWTRNKAVMMITKQIVSSKLRFWICQPINGRTGPTILLRNEILHFTLLHQRKKLLILLVEHQPHQILIKLLPNFLIILGVKSVVLWKEDITMDRSLLIHKLWLLVDIQSIRPQLVAGEAWKAPNLSWVIYYD